MVTEAIGKRPVHLSLLNSAYLEHLEGESLFSSVAAGNGRFECDKVLKPKGIDLWDLASNATIEVTVLRRRGFGSEMQKQLLYRAMISLSMVRAMQQGPSDPGDGTESDKIQAWEGWLGLVPIESPVNNLSPEFLFQKCYELGNSREHPSPRLLVRLHMPASTVLRHDSHPCGPCGTERRSQSYVPQATQVPTPLGGLNTAWQGPNPDKELEALRLRNQSLEKQLEACRSERIRRQESKELTQVRWLLAKHGWQLPGEISDPTEQVLATLTEILQQEDLRRSQHHEGQKSGLYKPLRSDPVDCLVAAELLRCGLNIECRRLAPGQYQFGEGIRLCCYMDSGCLMSRPLEAEDQPAVAMEFAQVLSKLRSAGTDDRTA